MHFKEIHALCWVAILHLTLSKISVSNSSMAYDSKVYSGRILDRKVWSYLPVLCYHGRVFGAETGWFKPR